MEQIDLAQDRGKWRVVVNAEMNFRLPQKCGESFELRKHKVPNGDSALWYWLDLAYDYDTVCLTLSNPN